MLFTQRNIGIFKAVLDGESYGTIGKRYDVSRQRIQQLLRVMCTKVMTQPVDNSDLKLSNIIEHKDFFLTEINKKIQANNPH